MSSNDSAGFSWKPVPSLGHGQLRLTRFSVAAGSSPLEVFLAAFASSTGTGHLSSGARFSFDTLSGALEGRAFNPTMVGRAFNPTPPHELLRLA